MSKKNEETNEVFSIHNPKVNLSIESLRRALKQRDLLLSAMNDIFGMDEGDDDYETVKAFRGIKIRAEEVLKEIEDYIP